MECLDANVVQDLMSGALEAGARSEVLAHIDRCADCRELLAACARAPIGILEPGAVVRTRAPARADGRRIGRYELKERLGAGAMGVVWRARDPELGREVAVKELARPTPMLTARLVREARAMARLNDVHVVAVYDVGVSDGATYIAMELVPGTTLGAWQAGGRRTIPEIVQAYVAAGRGLAAAHAAGIVHRDFKPDNVLVGEDGRVRVTDFGLAGGRVEPSAPAETAELELSGTAAVIGTPAYMAPEQLDGGHVDARTDQFSFCVALYEALYGERPFDGKTFELLRRNVRGGRIRPAPDHARVSRGLRAILVRGMSVRPGDRYPTMEHLLAELGRDRARPWRRTAIAAVTLAAVLAGGLASDQVVRARGERQIQQAFAATGAQIERAGVLQGKWFEAASSLVGNLTVMLAVTSHHDLADFGLAPPAQDAADLAALHATLVSQDWRQVRDLADHPTQIAVLDYKGLLLYTSAAPSTWRGYAGDLPAIARVLGGQADESLSVVGYDEPAFTAMGLFGATPPRGLAVMFVRTLAGGGAFLQFIDARDVLAGIRLDATQLGLVATDGRSAGDVPAALARAAPRDGTVAGVTLDGTSFEVQARPLRDPTGRPYARVVMARPEPGVLALFDHSRAVFAGAALAALAVALGALLRARRISSARR